MRDLDIRLALLTYLQRLHSDETDMLIAEEVNVRQGLSRADLVVVNSRLHCYEIKSQVDTLSRLAGQLEDYRCVFEQVSLVIGVKHLTGVLVGLPSWCGILLANRVGGEVEIESFRAASPNLHRDPYALAQLLWRDEALEILERYQCLRGVKSKPREALWERLAESLSLEDLGLEVRETLKARKSTWRATKRRRRRPRRVRRGRAA